MMTPMLMTALALALLAGPLGCFVVWRRMAYFGMMVWLILPCSASPLG